MRNYSQDIIGKVKALGIYQVVGGVVGIAFILWLLSRVSVLSNFLVLLIFGFAFVFYFYSIYCGIQCFKNVKKALVHSRINQLLQVLGFSMFGYAYQYVSGVSLQLGVDLSDSFAFKFNIGISTWQITINSGDSTMLVNINLVAVWLVVFIEALLNRINKADKLEQVSKLGQAEQPVRVE
jgi:hypothetical protein